MKSWCGDACCMCPVPTVNPKKSGNLIQSAIPTAGLAGGQTCLEPNLGCAERDRSRAYRREMLDAACGVAVGYWKVRAQNAAADAADGVGKIRKGVR